MKLKDFKEFINEIPSEHDEKEIVMANAFIVDPDEEIEGDLPKLAMEHRPIWGIIIHGNELEIHSFDSKDIVDKYSKDIVDKFHQSDSE